MRKGFVRRSTKVSEKVLDSLVFDVTSGVADEQLVGYPIWNCRSVDIISMVLIRAISTSLRRMYKRAPMLFLRDWRLWL